MSVKFLLVHVQACEFCRNLLKSCQKCGRLFRHEFGAEKVWAALGRTGNVRNCDGCQ